MRSFERFFLRQRRKKKRPIALANRRAATAEPTPMPIAAVVLTPLVEDGEEVWAGTSSWVGMEKEGTDVRVMMENPFQGMLVERFPPTSACVELTGSLVLGAGVGSPDLKRTWMP